MMRKTSMLFILLVIASSAALSILGAEEEISGNDITPAELAAYTRVQGIDDIDNEEDNWMDNDDEMVLMEAVMSTANDDDDLQKELAGGLETGHVKQQFFGLGSVFSIARRLLPSIVRLFKRRKRRTRRYRRYRPSQRRYGRYRRRQERPCLTMQYLVQKVSVAIQRENALSISGSLSSLPDLDMDYVYF
uniref:Uncharacterized protein 24 n=1 Tax=Halisarca dujardinii TaxID=2583056 RepID=A0AA96MMH7_HALDU|nr:uncharacterized protein 24 [Halisarca dujardinii]